jgi:hypothetical protein
VTDEKRCRNGDKLRKVKEGKVYKIEKVEG